MSNERDDVARRPYAAVAADNPIESADDDTLGRADVARRFAEHVLRQDASKGLVVGVLGAWGSGKTSFVNLALERIRVAGAPILDFNPWMFSGTEHLVNSFFVELAAQLKVRPGLAEIGKELEDYGEAFSGLAWLPLVGPWIERGRLASRSLSKLLQRRKEGIGDRRATLEKSLKALNWPIVVVLDDIDRLTTTEIRDVFKLVRLTASFPNVIYLVAFDRVRVEQALSEEGVPGRDYLEKILQLAFDLPAIPDQVLNRQIFHALDEALSEVENNLVLDQEVWPDVFVEIIRPLIRTMRDVRRYAAAVHGTVDALGGQVALADILALEAVRVFHPDVFGSLHEAVPGLTTTAGWSTGGRDESPELKQQIEALIAVGDSQEEVVRSMISRLFPAAQRHLPHGTRYGDDWQRRWLRERRVAHEEILRLYLERVVGQGLEAFRAAERAWAVMTDRDAFETHLRSLSPDQLEDVIASLETYEDEFTAEHAVPGTIVLLNVLPDLPDRPRGMFYVGARFVVGRVTFRLLRAAGDPDAVEQATSEILPELTSLSSKLEVITDVGYRENAGHKLVSEVAAAKLEKAWRDEVRSSSVEDLIKEWDLIRILLVTKREAEASEGELSIPDSPEMTRAMLQSAHGESRRQSVGSRAVRRAPRLAWDVLVELYGGEEILRKRINELKAAEVETDTELLELADKYLEGWRPTDYGDD